MKKYVLGMDGGATKTHCTIFDIHGDNVDTITWGPTNHEVLREGFADLKIELEKLISFILIKNGIDKSELKRCAFGMAGVDTKKQHEIISGIIKEIGINDFILCNDAFLGVKAGCEGGYGICAINGTGCSVAGIDPSGKMLQIGGQGDLTGDYGGGGFLGKTAVSSVYNSLFKDNKNTIMSDMFFEMLNINSKYDYMDALTHAISEGKHKLKDLNRIVFAAANKGDEGALGILEKIGMEYAWSINGVMNLLDFNKSQSLDVILTGSVFVNGENPMAVNKLEQVVLQKNKDKKINFKILKIMPVAGAAVWALNGICDDRDIYFKVMSQFS